MRNLKVSVLMPVYNGEKYIREAIDSILGQTFKDFEFLIIDDGSTDKTREILENYDDSRIKLINNKKNIGLTKSLNKGLKLARGEYIARQDSDDVSMPKRLEKEVSFLNHNKNTALVGTYYYMINERDKILKIIKPPTKSEEIKIGLLKGNQFGHGSVMFRVECIKEVGYYREELGSVEDYDLWLRVSDRYNIANIPEPLYKWRLNIKSVSVAKKSLMDKYALLAIELAKERRQLGKDKLQILKKEEIKDFLDIYLNSKSEYESKKQIAQNYYSWSRVLFVGKDYKGAFKLLFKSFVSYPLNKETWVLVFKDLAILLLPKSVINVLRYIKRSIF
jgi:glycosyltransferase involved in cell wall biosynthesis